MRRPKPKTRNNLTPEILQLRKELEEWEGELFEEPKLCPRCGSEERTRWDSIDRIFCRTISRDGEGFDEVKVEVKRFHCEECGHVYEADAPFYPDADYGKPVVDLCLYLAASNPSNRVEGILMDLGVQVDRDTVRRYTHLFEEKLEELAGIEFMDESLGVNFVSALFKCGSIGELKEECGEEFFETCSDETYPAKKGAKEDMRKENAERKYEGEKRIPYPEGFCASFSYVPSHGFYASSVIRDFDFNFLLAKVLMAPTEGADWRVMDGHPSYNDFDHWYCLLHRFKKEMGDDEVLKLLREDFPHRVGDYLSRRYESFREEKLEELKEEYPDLFEDGEFKGSLTTNAMEGGHWRLKYELRTQYSVTKSISARMNLMAFKESLHTFRGGEPCESWAHENSEFRLEDVMSIELEKTSHLSIQKPSNEREKTMVGTMNELVKSPTDRTSAVGA